MPESGLESGKFDYYNLNTFLRGALSHPDQNYREQKRELKTSGRITRGFKTKGRGRLDSEET